MAAAGRDPKTLAWWERIPGILGYPLTTAGIAGSVIIGFLAWMGRVSVGGMGPAGLTMRIFLAGLLFASIFLVIRSSAHGSTDSPVLEVTDYWDDIVVPGVKGTLLGVLLYLPALVGWLEVGASFPSATADAVIPTAHGHDASPPPAELARLCSGGLDLPMCHGTPTPSGSDTPAPEETPAAERMESRTVSGLAGWAAFALFAALGASLIYPLSMIVLAMSERLFTAVNPIVWAGILRQVFLPYLGLLLGLGGLGVAAWVVELPVGLLDSHVPLLPSLLSRIVSVYFALCSAHLMGWFIWQYRSRLGFDASQSQPTATVRDTRSLEQWKADMKAAEAGGGSQIPAPPWQQAQVAAPPSAPDPLPVDPSNAAGLIGSHWQAGHLEDAHAVYRAVIGLERDFCLEPSSQLRLAKELERADPLTAAGAWRALALKHPDHPQAPRALFRCSDCYRKGGRQDWGTRALEILVERYPMSEEGQLAASTLRSLKTAKR